MILIVREEVLEGEKGLELCFDLPSASAGQEWLITNGFQHVAPDEEDDYWKHDGGFTITFRNGIHDSGPINQKVKVERLVIARFIRPIASVDVRCEFL